MCRIGHGSLINPTVSFNKFVTAISHCKPSSYVLNVGNIRRSSLPRGGEVASVKAVNLGQCWATEL
jgi:hypothetical protein